ncbi:DUF4412 domain-containing protein [Gammaproteobacteria bacterium]
MKGVAVVSVIAAMGFASGVQAGDDISFMADMVQQGPQGQVAHKLFVDKKKSRMEMVQNGQQIVQIVDMERQLVWILNPSQKNYMEVKPEGPLSAMPQTAGKDPCAGLSGATCKQLGEETLSGRKVVKWEVHVPVEGQNLTAYEWVDAERGTPLRRESSMGNMEMRLLDTEKLNGRTVEKWEVTATRPQQPPIKMLRWFDPILKFSVKQELPGGMMTELKNIQEGPQPASLFSLPAGYAKVALPQGMPPAH